MRRIALLFLLLTCGQTIASTRLHVAKQVAEWRWGTVCHGHVDILNAPLKPPLIAFASWNQDRTSCNVTYTTRIYWPWWRLCRVTVHEWGHLAGYRARHPYVNDHGRVDWTHSRYPDSLMYPYTWEPYSPCGPDHQHPRFGSASP